MNGKEATSKIVKEQWLDKLHYKKVKLEKLQNAIGRNITLCSSKTEKAFLGLWKQWKSAKVNA